MLSFHFFTRTLLTLTALLLFSQASLQAFVVPAAEQPEEQQLIAVLQSDAPAAEKAISCKNLAIYGSNAAVPELAKLLPDPELSSWARIALEAIPGDEADAALRNAAETLEGRLLVGMINSIGVRRDANAVTILDQRLKDSDAEVAASAAVALGQIGNAAAADVLRQSLSLDSPAVRSAVAEGCVLCAERFDAAGQTAEATALYDLVRAADVPKQRIVEATRGAILTRGGDGIPLLTEQLRSSDKVMFQLALSTAREFPGADLDQVLAAELASAAPDRAALIVQAMADRPDTVLLAAIRDAAGNAAKPVRLSAVDALKRVGDDSCLDVLLTTAMENDVELADAARTTLAELPGAEVDAQIVRQLPKAQGTLYPLLLELVGRRRIAAVPEVIRALSHSDAAVRAAALTALGQTVSLKQLDVLITQVVSPKNSADAEVARQALRTASVRMPDRDACATVLAAAVSRAPAMVKTFLLETLAEVGGAKALQTLGDAARRGDAELLDTSSRLLGKWNSLDVAPILLELSANSPYRLRALRGYIGLARKFDMPEDQRVQMCRNALSLSDRPDELRLILDVLKIHPSPPAFRMASDMTKIENLKDEATAVALAIAKELGGKGVNVEELLKAASLNRVELEIIRAEYGAGTAQKDVTDLLKKQVTGLPLILLDAGGYNAAFGGDPAPGVPKQLIVRYRMNGKPAEARFAENDPILLPMPKS